MSSRRRRLRNRCCCRNRRRNCNRSRPCHNPNPSRIGCNHIPERTRSRGRVRAPVGQVVRVLLLPKLPLKPVPRRLEPGITCSSGSSGRGCGDDKGGSGAVAACSLRMARDWEEVSELRLD